MVLAATGCRRAVAADQSAVPAAVEWVNKWPSMGGRPYLPDAPCLLKSLTNRRPSGGATPYVSSGTGPQNRWTAAASQEIHLFTQAKYCEFGPYLL